jgi:mRNA interferase MazF
VYLADLNPVKGSEQAGRRPVLIYQDDRLIQATRTVIVIPFTTNLKLEKLPSGVLVPAGEGGLRQDSVALCHQIRALDKKGMMKHWESLPENRMTIIDQVVLRTIGVCISQLESIVPKGTD